MSTRRATRTPGAKEPEQTTQEQADQALEEILNDTSAGALAPAEQFDAVAERTEQLDQILENQKRIEKKLDQLLKAGGIEAPKQKRFVLGKNGYEEKEI